MFVFSVNAITPEPFDDYKRGDEVPFIVYLNFLDLYGAEQLCRLYMNQQGFSAVKIEKRKMIEAKFLQNKKLINADPNMKEAIETGYAIQVFAAH